MNLQTMANACAADKLWMYMEVEHAQGPGTTKLYPASIGVVGHVLEVREHMF